MGILGKKYLYFASPSIPEKQKAKTAIKMVLLTFILFVTFLEIAILGEVRKPIII
jgi:hypothetical protein